MKITRDAVVELRYRLFDSAGEEVEASDPDEPTLYRHGSAEILPGLERALEGAAAGERIRTTLPPEEAYGRYDPEGIVIVPLAELPPGDYRPGDWLAVAVEPDEAEDVEGGEIEMRVLEVHDDSVVMDANHPLAGQSVTFEVEIVSVEPADRRPPPRRERP